MYTENIMYSFDNLITHGITGGIIAALIWAGGVIMARLADKENN